MNAQLDLGMPLPVPEVSKEEIDRVCDHLKGKGWVKAGQIEAELGKKMNERKIRKIAEFSEGRILSRPGLPGYKLLTPATEIAEVDLCASGLESQGRKMLLRGTQIRRRFHRYARPA